MTWTLLDQCVFHALSLQDLEFLADWFCDAEWHEPRATMRGYGWAVRNDA